MLKQLRFHIGMHRIKDKIHTLSSGQFGSRDKIGISRKQDYFVNKTLKRQSGYIHAYFHVYPFLVNLQIDILVRQSSEA